MPQLIKLCREHGCNNPADHRQAVCRHHKNLRRRVNRQQSEPYEPRLIKTIKATPKVKKKLMTNTEQLKIDKEIRNKLNLQFSEKIYTKEEICKIAHQITPLEKIKGGNKSLLLPDFY